jgi:hypothetical protein
MKKRFPPINVLILLRCFLAFLGCFYGVLGNIQAQKKSYFLQTYIIETKQKNLQKTSDSLQLDFLLQKELQNIYNEGFIEAI